MMHRCSPLTMGMSRRVRLGVVGLLIVSALAVVLLGNEPEVQYSVDEVMASPEEYDDGQVHLRGVVAIDSFNAQNNTFLLSGTSHNLTVDSSGVAIPPAFSEGRVVAVKGELLHHDDGWTLSADEIITGCPSKYEAE